MIHKVSEFRNSERIPDVKTGESSIIPSTSVRKLEVTFDEAGLMTEPYSDSILSSQAPYAQTD